MHGVATFTKSITILSGNLFPVLSGNKECLIIPAAELRNEIGCSVLQPISP
jgi:hypothetical protein